MRKMEFKFRSNFVLLVLLLCSAFSGVHSQFLLGDFRFADRVELETASHTCGHPDSGMTSFREYNEALLREIPPNDLPERTCDYTCARMFDQDFSRVNRYRIENFNMFGQFHADGCEGYTPAEGTNAGSGSGDAPSTTTSSSAGSTSEFVGTIESGNFCAIKDLQVNEQSVFGSTNLTFHLSVKISDVDVNRHG